MKARLCAVAFILSYREGVLLLKNQYRIKRNKDFQAIYRKKNAVAAGVVVLYIMDNKKDIPRAGFSVSKKLGNAVVRNRCKRLLREAVRRHLKEFRCGKDYVFVARKSLAEADFLQIEKDILCTVKRKNCFLNERPASGEEAANAGGG